MICRHELSTGMPCCHAVQVATAAHQNILPVGFGGARIFAVSDAQYSQKCDILIRFPTDLTGDKYYTDLYVVICFLGLHFDC